MNNPYNYGNRSIQQTYRSPMASGYGSTQMNKSSGEVSKGVMFAVIGILVVAIVVWVIINFILYKDDKAWFKVYKAPPPPAGSIQPNGDGTGGSLDPTVNDYKNKNLAGYAAKNPSTTPTEFGPYITQPPAP
jgi:hypothetical protein